MTKELRKEFLNGTNPDFVKQYEERTLPVYKKFCSSALASPEKYGICIIPKFAVFVLADYPYTVYFIPVEVYNDVLNSYEKVSY